MDFVNSLLSIIESEDTNIQERLQSCNNAIEKDFSSLKNYIPTPEVLKSLHGTVEDTAKALHNKLVSIINIRWNCRISIIDMKREGEQFASDVTMRVAKSIALQQTDHKTAIDNDDEASNSIITLVSELLRGCKNLIRWFRIILSNSRVKNETVAVDRLCSIGMIRLCVALLEIYSETEKEDNESRSSRVHETVLRSASTTLFHSTFGPAVQQSKAVRKGLAYLVENDDFNWISIMVKLLVGSHSVPVMLSIVRNLHNLVGSIPGITNKINDELDAVIDQNCERDGEPSMKGNVLSALVPLLAWTLNSKPTFPGNDSSDLRSELAIEILRVLFAIRGNGATISKQLEESNPELMTQLGILLVDILHLPNSNTRAYETKLAVLGLLMDPPPSFCQFLVVNKAIDPLFTILWLQLNDILVVHGARVCDKSATCILPVLVVLNKLSQFHPTIKKDCKNFIFPPETDSDVTVALGQNDLISGNVPSKNIKPINAPPGTIRFKLIRLMTFVDSNVKRCASELLWTLCDGNPKEFVTRTGFGNAVHMLGIKGIVQIPT